MFVDVLERLYDLTGECSLTATLVSGFTRITAPQRILWDMGDANLASLLDLQKPLLGHGATTNEQLRVPVWAYIVSGNPDFRNGL